MSEQTKQVQKWADPAMYAAAEQETNGPKVQLLSCTPDPLGAIAAAADGYHGKFHGNLAEITDEQRRGVLDDTRKSILAAPLEFVHFHFRITGVTRGFTHQMVRQRTATYVQESMRFAVKETVPVALPPSLMGTMPWNQWVGLCSAEHFPTFHPTDNIVQDFAEQHATKEQIWRREWDWTVDKIGLQYNALVNSGMPAEDARGLLPTSVLTQLNYTTSLRHLIEHAGLRLCTQAQFEWRLVWVEILKAIREYGSNQYYARPPEPLDLADRSDMPGYPMYPASWQFEEIAKIFKPICFNKGSCQFMSSADRYCKIRDRVQAFSANNVPSSEWDSNIVGNIRDEEWLADPTSARA